jgi:1,2-phenylacetyl-CoA epoxidase PaaB subunit
MMATGELYEVFARKVRAEPLEHVGTVNATSADFARVYARTTYDEENWVEMVVVRRADLITVIALEPLVKEEEIAS